MGTIVLYIIIIAALVAYFNFSKAKYKQKVAQQSGAGATWWNNQERSPLSEEESRQLADTVARFYSLWREDGDMNHKWLCIAINPDSLVCKALYQDFNRGQVPAPSYSFSHSLSCQADREALADCILTRLRQDDPDCPLYLEGDALILPTN